MYIVKKKILGNFIDRDYNPSINYFIPDQFYPFRNTSGDDPIWFEKFYRMEIFLLFFFIPPLIQRIEKVGLNWKKLIVAETNVSLLEFWIY